MKKVNVKKLSEGTYLVNVYMRRIWQVQIINGVKCLKHIKDCNAPDSKGKNPPARPDLSFDDVNWPVLEIIPDTEVFVELL